jgi:hypothetical protein
LELAEQATERRSRGRVLRTLSLIGLAAALAVGGLAVGPHQTFASGKKVVVVVGPVGSLTGYFKDTANTIAATAKSYGANVIKIYTPYATWDRVRNAAAGANVLIYVGHGNGWPSPYKPFQTYTKDGMGLNAHSGGSSSSSNLKYWGERYVAGLSLARNSVVILMRLCYASGNNEPGKGSPTASVAKQRVDNYGAGFLRSGARAVFAQGLGSAAYIFKGLYGSNKTIKEIFWSSPDATYSHRMAFSAVRSPSWAHAEMDPYRAGRYYRSVIGDMSMTAADWR